MRNLVLVTHVYNEAFLMPYFVRHYRSLVDVAVVLDYDSTDDGMDAVRELAPEWQIRRSRNRDFNARACDLEVMDAEQELESRYPGSWKLVVNTTELVLHYDIKEYLRSFENLNPYVPAVAMHSAVMVDAPERRHDAIDDRPLHFQKFHGYVDRAAITRPFRYMHRSAHGSWGIGRHGTGQPSVLDAELILSWWGWSPIEHVRARKLQIQTRIPPEDRAAGLGREHLQTPDNLEATYLQHVAMSSDLRTDAVYARRLSELGPPAAAASSST